jgi:hypothetical protein
LLAFHKGFDSKQFVQKFMGQSFEKIRIHSCVSEMSGGMDRITAHIHSSRTADQLQGCCQMMKLLEDESLAFEFASRPGLPHRLLFLSLHATSNVQTRACILLQKLTGFERIASIFMNETELLNAVLGFLRASERQYLRGFGCAILANVSFFPDHAERVIRKQGIVPALLDAISGDTQTRTFACDALYNLCHSPIGCGLLTLHRAAFIARLSSLLTDRDARASLCASLCIINTMERNSAIPDECQEAFTVRSVGAIVAALDAALHEREYLGNMWRPLGCLLAINTLSSIHKCRGMLERQELVKLLLLAVQKCAATSTLLAVEALLNILTSLPKHVWGSVLGDSVSRVYQQMVQVRDRLTAVPVPRAVAVTQSPDPNPSSDSSLQSLNTLIDLLAPSVRSVHLPTPTSLWPPAAVASSTSQPPTPPIQSSSSRSIDVLGEIISSENNLLRSNGNANRILQPVIPAKAINDPPLRPGQKRCPTCQQSCPVRASKCVHCDFCFYLTVSANTSTKPVGKGHKLCPVCDEVCAAKQSRCRSCDHVFFSTKRTQLPEQEDDGLESESGSKDDAFS